MAFGFTYTLPTISGSHTDAPILLKTVDFPPSAIDGTANSLTNGGGSLIAYTDNTKTTRLSVDVVRLVSGGSPYARVWVKIPTAATSNTIFIENDDAQTSQPAFGAAFGRNSVWSDFELVIHGDNNTPVDSTGNHTVSTNGSPSTVSTTIGDGISINSGNAGGTAAQWVRVVGTIATSTTDIYQSINLDLRSAATGQKVIDLYNNSGGGSGSVDYVDTSGSNFRGVLNNSGSFIASSSSVTGIQRCTQFTDTNQRLLKDGSLVASSSKPGSFDTYDSLVIGKNGASNDQSVDAIIVDYFYGEFTSSVNLDLLFADNQLSTTAWGSVGSWADSGGGGVTVTGATANYNYTGIVGVIDLTGEIIVTGSTANYNYTGITGSIDLTGEVIVIGQTANYNYSGIAGTVEIGAEIIVTGQTANYNYAGIDGAVELTALITVIGQTANYDYAGIAADVTIQGAIVVTGNTANYDYTGVNATIKLQGPIVVNPRNIIMVKRKSNIVRVKRNSNTIQVR